MILNSFIKKFQFDLTCDDEWKQTFASTVYMFGMLIGAATLGNIADA